MSPGRLGIGSATGPAPVGSGASPAPAQKCRVPLALNSTARTAGLSLACVKASVSASRANGDNEFPASGRSIVTRATPSAPIAHTIPDASSDISLTPALTAFPFFGYLNFHLVRATKRATTRRQSDGADRPDHR